MPNLVLNTNVSKDSIPDGFILKLSKILAENVGKPEQYIAVHINPDQMMSFGGSTEPCALGYLGSIGKISREENIKYTQVLMELLAQELGIKKDRMYIHYTNYERENVGWNGRTFAS